MVTVSRCVPIRECSDRGIAHGFVCRCVCARKNDELRNTTTDGLGSYCRVAPVRYRAVTRQGGGGELLPIREGLGSVHPGYWEGARSVLRFVCPCELSRARLRRGS